MIGGTDSWNREFTCNTVPSPPKVIIKSIISFKVVTKLIIKICLFLKKVMKIPSSKLSQWGSSSCVSCSTIILKLCSLCNHLIKRCVLIEEYDNFFYQYLATSSKQRVICSSFHFFTINTVFGLVTQLKII